MLTFMCHMSVKLVTTHHFLPKTTHRICATMDITTETTTAELLKVLTSPETDEATYAAAVAENRRRLLAEKQKKEEEACKTREVVSALRSLGLSFEHFMMCTDNDGQPAFSSKEVKHYAQSQGWLKEASTSTEANVESSEKPMVNVGTFKLSDYGFVMPFKGKTEKPVAADTEFVWNINQFYPATTWQYKFIKTITAKGLDDIQKHLTPEFKAWLEECIVPNKGPMANKAIYKNKRKFMIYFGLDENGQPLKD